VTMMTITMPAMTMEKSKGSFYLKTI